MMMRKSILATGVALVIASSVSWGFGLPKIPGVSAATSGDSGGVTADSVEQFVVAGQVSNLAINEARVMLAAALSTKEERAKLMSQREQINKGLDAKDKKAAEESKAFAESLDAQLKAGLADQSKVDSLKSLSADQKKAVGNSVLSLGYGIMLQKDQITAGQNMITQMSSNPMLATKLPSIKNTVTTMAANLSGTAGYITNLPKLLSAVNVKAKMPTSKDDKPAEAPANITDVFANN